MNVTYKGLHRELPEKLQSKLDAKFAKLSKLLERRGEREAHVIVKEERHLQHAEITIQFYDHQLVAEAADPDLFTAFSSALAKLEAQAVKQRGRWREKHRRESPPAGAASVEARVDGAGKRAAAHGGNPGPQVHRVTLERRKPITLDEAVLLMDKSRDYLVYRDAQSERMSVLVRRRDGHFDLIEC
jgi:putative sigma-54 modulation protein